ncbi:hypothetical protein GQX73_g1669 [Xylaria multiplex]|uniref:Uncharacterized protein n=1 Tax=Xylaria multiplex TaxID=323545 RepID=A0A7C8IWM7_9PEZI|nr:hypothetical protein GQX73_g1669 [Xylaria multiplex]
MVFIRQSTDVPRLNAYLLSSFPHEELEPLKRAFELGTAAPFATMLELVIRRAPADYEGKSHEYMRREEDKAGREGPFIVIDSRGAGGRDGAVWYVDRFADEDEVEEGIAESTDMVWKIPVKTECLALKYVNYDALNISLQEDLGHLGVEEPLNQGYEFPTADDCAGLDMLEQRASKYAHAVAVPGEFEESTEKSLRENMRPEPAKVARLKGAVAEAAGLVSDWTFCSEALPERLPDGAKKTFPEGSIILLATYNPNFGWPEYKWPEGSL